MKGRRGFVLMEMIIFIIVAGIFVPLSYIAFSAALKSGVTPETYTNARFLAERRMEDLTSLRYDLITGSGNQTYSLPVGAANRSYQVNWTVSYVTDTLAASPGGAPTNYKRIRVWVTSPSYEVNTLMTKRPGDE
jgi:hypothetical protein